MDSRDFVDLKDLSLQLVNSVTSITILVFDGNSRAWERLKNNSQDKMYGRDDSNPKRTFGKDRQEDGIDRRPYQQNGQAGKGSSANIILAKLLFWQVVTGPDVTISSS